MHLRFGQLSSPINETVHQHFKRKLAKCLGPHRLGMHRGGCLALLLTYVVNVDMVSVPAPQLARHARNTTSSHQTPQLGSTVLLRNCCMRSIHQRMSCTHRGTAAQKITTSTAVCLLSLCSNSAGPLLKCASQGLAYRPWPRIVLVFEL